MLSIDKVDCFYGEVQVLREISFELGNGETLCVMGRNGAGKTSLLRAIMGLLPATRGRINLDGTELTSLAAHEVPRQGIAYVPQGRRLFADLSVRENLEMGLMARRCGEEVLVRTLDLFPILRDRLAQSAGTLSGGEQQMLATARALCVDPKVLLLDEPTEGLMPSMIARVIETVAGLKARGMSTILVEQRVDAVLALADRVAFMETGRLKEVATPDQIRRDPALLHHYVGVGLRAL